MANHPRNLLRRLARILIGTLGALGALAPAACLSVTPPGVHLSSTPPGARIQVDGRDSGFVTPASLDLGGDHWLQLSLDGYEPADIYLEGNTRTTVVPWTKGITSTTTPWFPLFLPLEDLMAPAKVDRSPSPKRIYVKLRLSVEQ